MFVRLSHFCFGVDRSLRSRSLKLRCRLGLLVALALGGGWTDLPSATAQITTWTGAVNDSWFNAGNWNNGIPNSAAFSAVVGAPSPTDFSGSNTVGNLSVLAGGVLNLGSGSNFNFDPAASIANAGQINLGVNSNFRPRNTITNSGTITVDGSGSASDIELTSATSLTGSGTVFLNGANARFNDVLGAATVLTNGVGHTIRGGGQIGVNTIDVVNNGTIRADVTGQTMTIDPQAALTNNGLLRAENGGILRLTGGAYANSGGSIVSAGGQVQLAGAAITGGLLTGADVFLPSASNTTFTDLTTNATIQVATNVNLIVNGTVTNNGSIALDGSGSASDIELTSATSLTGSGTVFLNGANARFNDVLGAATVLTNGVGHTIRGGGQIGVSTIDVLNNGTIQADVMGQPMTIDPQGALTNNGLLRADNGGVLRLNNGAYNSTNGRLEAVGPNSRIERGTGGGVTTVTFGDVRATAGGAVNVADSSTVDFDLQTNNHTLEFRGETTFTDLFGMSGSLPGSLRSKLFNRNNGLFIVGDGLDFTSNREGSSLDFNPGTIVADQGSTFAYGGFSRQDIICAVGSPCDPDGLPPAEDVLPISSSGTLAGAGTIANHNALVNFYPSGTNRLLLPTFTTAGVVSPGIGSLSTETLTLVGDDVILGDTNNIAIEVGEMVSDAVSFVTRSGVATDLNGTLSVSLLPTYVPTTGDQFTILTAAQGFAGTFDTVNLPTFGGLLSWQVNYNPTSVVLQVVSSNLLPGDYNRNGVVDAPDYTVYRDGLGAGFVAADYLVWRDNFGAMSPAAAQAIPEPAAVLIALLAIACCWQRRGPVR